MINKSDLCMLGKSIYITNHCSLCLLQCTVISDLVSLIIMTKNKVINLDTSLFPGYKLILFI